MSDYAERVAEYEEQSARMALACLCGKPSTHLLSWEKHNVKATGLSYCDECGSHLLRSLRRDRTPFIRDDLTDEIRSLRIARFKVGYPMAYRSTVHEVA